MEEIILKLINSSSEDDTLIAASFIAELKAPREFMKEHGILLHSEERSEYKHLGPRYCIGANKQTFARCYYRVYENYYLLVRSDVVGECYTNYSNTIPVIEHKPIDHG